MKTIKHITLFLFVISMLFSGFNFTHGQEEALFSETYSSSEVLSLLEKDDPFFSLIDRKDTDIYGSKLGYCYPAKQEALMKHLHGKALSKKFPDNLRFAWGKSNGEGKQALYALKVKGKSKGPGIENIQSVSMKPSEQTESWDLFITFNEEGTKSWARMTRENIGRDIAIVVNGKVISAPKVQDEIKFGKCRISGDLDKKEAAAIKEQLEN